MHITGNKDSVEKYAAETRYWKNVYQLIIPWHTSLLVNGPN